MSAWGPGGFSRSRRLLRGTIERRGILMLGSERRGARCGKRPLVSRQFEEDGYLRSTTGATATAFVGGSVSGWGVNRLQIKRRFGIFGARGCSGLRGAKAIRRFA